MVTALVFMVFNIGCYMMALKRGPYWALFAYMNIYFNAPNELLNWWAPLLPFSRWTLLTTAILLISLVLHRDKLSSHKLENAKWVFIFFFASIPASFFGVVDSKIASSYLYLLFSYCIIVFVIIKSLKSPDQLRLFLFGTVVFSGLLSLSAYFNGRRINDRLEMAGAGDAYGSNEFSLLLAAIIPLLFSFIKYGRPYEKIITLVSLPFIVNAFILCNSRGSTVALAGGIIVAAMLVADKKMRRGLLVVLFISAPAFLYLSDDAFIERFTSLGGVDSAMEDEDAAKNLSSGRTEIWGYGLQMVDDYPFGAGPNGFKELARFYMPNEVLTFKPGAAYGVRSAHNTYLQVTVEQGVIGILIWVTMCLSTCNILYKSFKRMRFAGNKDPFWVNIAFALNMSFFSVLIGGMVNSRVYYEFFWWQIAVAAVLFAISKKLNKTNVEAVTGACGRYA